MAKSEKRWIMTVSHINTKQLSDKEYKDKQPDKQPIKQKKRQRYDYPALKQEFFNSDIAEIKSFLDSKWIGEKINETKTKWWTKEKQEYKKKIAQRTIEKTIERESTKLSQKIDVDKLIRMKHDFFDTIDMAIEQMQSADKVNMKDLIAWLNAIKTELGETTSINQNKNETEITWMNINFTWV